LPGSAATELETAGKVCGVNTVAVREKLCKNALAGKSFAFLGRNCPDEAAPIAQAECAGRGYSGGKAVDPPYQEFCNAYAGQKLMKPAGTAGAAAGGAAAGSATAGAEGSTTSGDGQQGTDTVPPPKDTALDASKKALKKLFPF
jgi:hypothetical protein